MGMMLVEPGHGCIGARIHADGANDLERDMIVMVQCSMQMVRDGVRHVYNGEGLHGNDAG